MTQQDNVRKTKKRRVFTGKKMSLFHVKFTLYVTELLAYEHQISRISKYHSHRILRGRGGGGGGAEDIFGPGYVFFIRDTIMSFYLHIMQRV